MAPLITLREIGKQHGAQRLFSNFSFSINQRDRIGVIGPNGSGKSSILKILAGLDDVDEGSIIRSRGLSVSYVSQLVPFDEKGSLQSLIEKECDASNGSKMNLPRVDESSVIAFLDLLGIKDLSISFNLLSGGQKKKVQLALKMAEETDLLLLDEPSNHLDLDSIIQLEGLLAGHQAASVMISHDRWLLENYASRILEINPQYPGGCFFCEGNYSDYLRERELFLESDAKQFESLKNKVRTEEAWLRQGAKARSTKSKHRTESAFAMIDTMKQTSSRRSTSESKIEFNASGRKTKRLIEIEHVKKSLGDTLICEDLNLSIVSGLKLAIMGPNGSGKTTLMKLILGEIAADDGLITRATDLKFSYFSQLAETIDPKTPLCRVLCDEGDAVVYQGRSLHIASWASRFQFDAKMLQQPYGSLSGGERAKARISKLMLETPDVLLLDEPTNDLDIRTLEILEESLLEFPGALILVSHDRSLLSNVSNTFLALDGEGGSQIFSSYEQWQNRAFSGPKEQQKKNSNDELKGDETIGSNQSSSSKKSKKKLGFKEQQEYKSMESEIQKAEKKVETLEEKVSKAEGKELSEFCAQLGEAQAKVESLYARWAVLESEIQS